MSDVVLRLILTTRPTTRAGKALVVYPDPSEQGRLIEDMGDKDNLSWSDRRLAWARLCLPVTAKAQQIKIATKWPLEESMLKYKIEPVIDDYVERKSVIKPKIEAYTAQRYARMAGVPLDFPRPRQYTEEELLDDVNQATKPTLSGWLPFRVRTSAVFGHVLHLNHKNVAASLKEGTAALAASRRALAPLIPPITEMHVPGWVPYREPSNMSSMIVMRFTPILTNNPSTTVAAKPALELYLKASDDDVLSIDSLRAIAHTHIADICLPGEAVDARVTQRLVAELPGTTLASTGGMEPLMQFINSSLLDPAQGRLVTPPVVDSLGLPHWLFHALEADPQSPFLRSPHAELETANKKAAAAAPAASNNKKKGKKQLTPTPTPTAPPSPPYNPYLAAANRLTQTSYLFAGLEVHHRPTETAYDGWRLRYTSVEAGAGGGRRAELALTAEPAADTALRRGWAAVSAGAWLRSSTPLGNVRPASSAARFSPTTSCRFHSRARRSRNAIISGIL